MPIILCPGFHDRRLNDRLLTRFPSATLLSLGSMLDISRLDRAPLTLIGFSAGVITAMVNASLWRLNGGSIAAFFALDGWGVPLVGDFPIYRLSHDYFTHWSSHLLGGGPVSFYADPPVAHLTLWSEPERVTGWALSPEQTRRTDALTFLSNQLSPDGLGIIN
jgi:hypothetical protein